MENVAQNLGYFVILHVNKWAVSSVDSQAWVLGFFGLFSLSWPAAHVGLKFNM